MEVKITVNENNSIKLECGDKNIYIDPFKIKENTNDADYIFITHSHFDHFSPEDIVKIMKNDTKLIVAKSTYSEQKEVIDDLLDNVITVIPKEDYEAQNIHFSTVRAYNIEKKFHPKANDYCGYIITLNNEKYYICGDTDYIPEMEGIKAEYIFVPIGGTYTMDYIEASNMINTLKPRVVIPVHYGSVAGKKGDAKLFKERIIDEIECRILIK